MEQARDLTNLTVQQKVITFICTKKEKEAPNLKRDNKKAKN